MLKIVNSSFSVEKFSDLHDLFKSMYDDAFRSLEQFISRTGMDVQIFCSLLLDVGLGALITENQKIIKNKSPDIYAPMDELNGRSLNTFAMDIANKALEAIDTIKATSKLKLNFYDIYICLG
jgi:hypothetical protein